MPAERCDRNMAIMPRPSEVIVSPIHQNLRVPLLLFSISASF
jgi:hypothetical protein